MKFIADVDVMLFDERCSLKDALSACAVHRACGPIEARFEATTWDRHDGRTGDADTNTEPDSATTNTAATHAPECRRSTNPRVR
jgi:hypothetical protein